MPTRYFRSRRICLMVGRKEVSTTMQQFDAIVVGAGPAGSSAALAMARSGLQLALIERGEYPGAKNVSGAALYAPNLLAELLPGYWEEAQLERYLTRRAITFLGQEAAVSLDFRTQHFSRPPYNGFTILRPRFDRWLASKAEEAGALLITSTVVDDLLYKDGRVIGVLCRSQYPAVAPLVRDSVTLEYSAHMIPEGGWAMLPSLSRAGFMVVGDAAGFVFAAGLFLEGMNFAIASGLEAAATAQLAHADHDFSAQSMARYRKRLESSFVLKDLKNFKRAPAFVNNERLQNVYPELLCETMENIFRSNGKPRRKIGRVAFDTVRRKVPLRTLLRDGWQAGRALLF